MEIHQRNERRIMVAINDSEESMFALSWCLANIISSKPDGVAKDNLILLHAKPRPHVYTAMDGTGYLFSNRIMAMTEKYDNKVAENVTEKAMNMCAEFGNNVRVEMRVENGEARDVICQMAEELSPNVLVMGTHGSGIIKRAFLGSVSSYCAQNVNCPVLLVKKPK